MADIIDEQPLSFVEIGRFNDVDVVSIVDQGGRHWFTALVLARALGVARSTVTGIRVKNESEFVPGEDFVMLPVNGKSQLVFSEEGFLTVCDLSTSPVAYRLRKWFRKHKKVKHDESMGIVVYHEPPIKDDLSDIDPGFAVIRDLLDKSIQNRRRLNVLEASKKATENTLFFLGEYQEELGERIQEAEDKIQAFESRAVLHAGEMTATQLAQHVRWCSVRGGAHNMAVILAAVNAGFEKRDLVRKIPVEGPNGMTVEQYVFSVDGVTAFKVEIDAKYCTGDQFKVVPGELATSRGYKNKMHVYKQ